MNGLPQLLILSLGLVGQWSLGLAIACGLTGRFQSFPANEPANTRVTNVELAGLGFTLGIGGTAWLLFVWSWCGGRIGSAASLALAVAGLLCGLFCWWYMRPSSKAVTGGSPGASAPHPQGALATLPTPSSLSEEPPFVSETHNAALGSTCRRAVMFLALAAIIQVLMTPQRFWDERAIFGLRGIVLFEAGTVHSTELKHPDFVLGHPRYPLLIPLAEEYVYGLLGQVNDRWSKMVFPMLYLGMVLCFAGVFMRHTSRGEAWMWALVLATIPALMPHDYGFLCGQADAPVGCFHGVSVLYLWDYWRNRSRSLRLPTMAMGGARSLFLAGLCAGLCAFTKDEGLAFLMVDTVLILAFVVMAFIARQIGSHQIDATNAAAENPPAESRQAEAVPGFWTPLFYVIAVAIILTPWFAYRQELPRTTEMDYFRRLTLSRLLEETASLNWLVGHLVHRMFAEWWEWGAQWWLVIALWLMFPRRAFTSPQLLLIGDVVGALAALIVAGMLAPVKLEEHIGGSSHRFLMQIAPVAVVFAAGQLIGRRSPGSSPGVPADSLNAPPLS